MSMHIDLPDEAGRLPAETPDGKLSGVVGSHKKIKREEEKIMRHYLENHKFYVMNEDAKLVYKVGEFETYYGHDAIHIHLELVAGWDYVNPDENDVQGWCPADRFVDDVQTEIVAQYFLVEGMKEALEANDYKVLENITPNLQKIIDKHNQA